MAESDSEITPLQQLRSFDPASIARTDDLGRQLAFTDSVPTVAGIVQLFRQISDDILSELPGNLTNAVQNNATNCWATIKNMLAFNPNQAGNAAAERQGLVDQLKQQHYEAMTQLGPVLAFAACRDRDQSETEERAQFLLTQAEETLAKINEMQSQAQDVTTEVRKLAAEAGVATQATYFDEQATSHATAADKWQKQTYNMAWALGGFAALTWALGYILPTPSNAYQAVQLAVSKVLIFSTIAFILFLSARTLMAHRHNEVVNRHRNNALKTFNALADAATSEQTREVVLTHASACIYGPQESGFTKPGAGQAGPSLVEVLPRILGSQQSVGG